MSMALDSPMEALAINYLKNQDFLTAANATVWAWIAFLTAAISFSWKIKSSIIHSSSSSLPPYHPSSSSSNDEPPLQQLLDDELPSSSSPTPTTFCWLENRRSGKFSLHYGQSDQECHHEEEEERGMMRLDADEEHESMKGSSSMHKDDGYYQLVLKMKTREMGWYRYQDLSMLDGNVVRFWTE